MDQGGESSGSGRKCCLESLKHVKYVYIKSTTLPVPSSELGLSQPLSRQRVCPSPNSDDWRKSLALCLLCALKAHSYSSSSSEILNLRITRKKLRICNLRTDNPKKSVKLWYRNELRWQVGAGKLTRKLKRRLFSALIEGWGVEVCCCCSQQSRLHVPS